MNPINISELATKPLSERILEIAKKLDKDQGLTAREVSGMLECHPRTVTDAAKRVKCSLVLYPAGACSGTTYIVNPEHHADDINKQSQ